MSLSPHPPPPPPSAPDATEVTNPVKRIRWATHRATGLKADHKRHSLKERLHRRMGSNSEKKRDSLGKETGPLDSGDVTSSEADNDEQDAGRTVYFNIPLPAHERDEEGHPKAQYARNKIRTAKYTPLSFIPKNLWFQFHNIANVYFLFIIILGVSSSLGLCCSSR
jgi:phospholipid-translocating ATPase